MSFTIRPHRRVPVHCPVTYQTGLFEGHGIVWNLSLTGWRFSGSLPLRIGEVCSLTVVLPPYQPIYVAAGIVRWMRGEEYGVETLVVDDESREDIEEYLVQRVYKSAERIP
jgi:PilZ domain